jgi:hypothetical protein
MWPQLKPQGAAFAGVRTDTKRLRGFLQISGDAETFIGRPPPPVARAPRTTRDGSLRARHIRHNPAGAHRLRYGASIDHDGDRRGPKGQRDDTRCPDLSLVRQVRLRIACCKDVRERFKCWRMGLPFRSATGRCGSSDPRKFPDLGATVGDLGEMFGIGQLLAQLRRQLDVSCRAAYQKLMDAANHNLTRQLKKGIRMEGHMASASFDRILLLSDGISIALRGRGELKILYGL